MREISTSAIRRFFAFFFDCEGPCTKNDNAMEIFVFVLMLFGFSKKEAETAFTNLSVIDDIWGLFGKVYHLDRKYSPGHTLKVILPFIKALGQSLEELEEFSGRNILVVPNIDKVIRSLLGSGFEFFLISTSYDFFIRKFCELVGLDFKRTSCTVVEPKIYNPVSATPEQIDELFEFLRKLSRMPAIEYDHVTGRIFSAHQADYDLITKFIWQNVWNMEIGELMKKVHPVGQMQKWEAMERFLAENKVLLENAVYIGDSITDGECINRVREKGLAVMFNGKGKEVFRKANIAIIGGDARGSEEIIRCFTELGREGVLDYYKNPREAEHGGLIASITPENWGDLHDLSVQFRLGFRGAAIGSQT